MFKIVENRHFTHEVKVLTPVDGGFEEEGLKTTFDYLSTEEVKKFDLRTPVGTTAFLQAVVVTFSDLTDGNGAPVICTDDIRERLLINPNVRQAICTHYFEAVSKVKEGN